MDIADCDLLASPIPRCEFVYDVLNAPEPQIRLLRVQPGAHGTTLCGTLTTYLARDAPNYAALSYTWGRSDPDCSIKLNGMRMPVFKNLLRFLQQVRRQAVYRKSFFWIDALCINQADDADRSRQVARMSLIYREAEQVLLWLGPAHSQSQAGMKALAGSITDEDLVKIWWKPAGLGIRAMCERLYWSRLWVLQELALARSITVLCGPLRAAWISLKDFLDRARHNPPSEDREINLNYKHCMSSRAVSMINQVGEKVGSRTLYDQVLRSASLCCYETKDKIYGLLGFVDPTSHEVEPDYSVTVQSILHNVLRGRHRKFPPEHLQEVEQQCKDLADAVGIDVKSMFHVEEYSGSLQTFDGYEEDVEAFPLTCCRRQGVTVELPINLWWAVAYGHEAIIGLDVETHCSRSYDPNPLLCQHESPTLLERFHAYRTIEKALEIAGADMTIRSLTRRRQHWEDTPIFILLDMMLRFAEDSEETNLHGYQIVPHFYEELDVLQRMRREPPAESLQALTSTAVLHIAAALGRSTLINHLLTDDSFDPNRLDKLGRSPLGLAVQCDNPHAASILIQSGRVDVNLLSARMLFDQSNSTLRPHMVGYSTPILNLAVAHADWSTVEHLLRAGTTDLTRVDENGSTALHEGLHEGTRRGELCIINLVRKLEEHGINFNTQNNNGETPLHCDVLRQRGRDPFEGLIVDPERNVNLQTRSGCTPLHYAVGIFARLVHNDSAESERNIMKLAERVVYSLLRYADINVSMPNKAGETPLRAFNSICHKLRLNCQMFVITRALMARGADPQDARSELLPLDPTPIICGFCHCSKDHVCSQCGVGVTRMIEGNVYTEGYVDTDYNSDTAIHNPVTASDVNTESLGAVKNVQAHVDDHHVDQAATAAKNKMPSTALPTSQRARRRAANFKRYSARKGSDKQSQQER